MCHCRALAVLIPRETRLLTIRRDGGETLSTTRYDECREYTSRSRLLFDAPDSSASPGAASSAPASTPNPLSPGLRFECRIVTPIDSDRSAAGDPVEAVLHSPIRDKKNKVVAPVGTRLHGHLRLVEQRHDPHEYFRIGVQFESIELQDKRVPLRATLAHAVTIHWMTSSTFFLESGRTDAATGVGTLIFDERHLHVNHYDAEWITLPPSDAVPKNGDPAKTQIERPR